MLNSMILFDILFFAMKIKGSKSQITAYNQYVDGCLSISYVDNHNLIFNNPRNEITNHLKSDADKTSNCGDYVPTLETNEQCGAIPTDQMQFDEKLIPNNTKSFLVHEIINKNNFCDTYQDLRAIDTPKSLQAQTDGNVNTQIDNISSDGNSEYLCNRTNNSNGYLNATYTNEANPSDNKTVCFSNEHEFHQTTINTTNAMETYNFICNLSRNSSVFNNISEIHQGSFNAAGFHSRERPAEQRTSRNHLMKPKNYLDYQNLPEFPAEKSNFGLEDQNCQEKYLRLQDQSYINLTNYSQQKNLQAMHKHMHTAHVTAIEYFNILLKKKFNTSLVLYKESLELLIGNKSSVNNLVKILIEPCYDKNEFNCLQSCVKNNFFSRTYSNAMLHILLGNFDCTEEAKVTKIGVYLKYNDEEGNSFIFKSVLRQGHFKNYVEIITFIISKEQYLDYFETIYKNK
ncbi:hypothetical protein COBT_000936 [Conglomerata obtusa]